MPKTNWENLLVDSSRAVVDMVVDHVGTSEDSLRELFELALLQKGKLAMRAARVVDIADENNPGFGAFLVDDMYRILGDLTHHSVLRTFQRMLTRYPLPEDDEMLVTLLDQSMHWATSDSYPVAVRYYGLYNLQRLCLKEPDLRYEVIPLMESLMNESSFGLQHRIKQMKKELAKLSTEEEL